MIKNVFWWLQIVNKRWKLWTRSSWVYLTTFLCKYWWWCFQYIFVMYGNSEVCSQNRLTDVNIFLSGRRSYKGPVFIQCVSWPSLYCLWWVIDFAHVSCNLLLGLMLHEYWTWLWYFSFLFVFTERATTVFCYYIFCFGTHFKSVHCHCTLRAKLSLYFYLILFPGLHAISAKLWHNSLGFFPI